jgi:hypothetical protein
MTHGASAARRQKPQPGICMSGRWLTLVDTVESFNPILGMQLNPRQKKEFGRLPTRCPKRMEKKGFSHAESFDWRTAPYGEW